RRIPVRSPVRAPARSRPCSGTAAASPAIRPIRPACSPCAPPRPSPTPSATARDAADDAAAAVGVAGRPAPGSGAALAVAAARHPADRARRPVRRFVEAGALAWVRELDALPPAYDWVGSLELCSLVTGQAAGYARRHRL